MKDKKTKAAVLSIISNTILIIAKLIIGIITKSLSIISEAIHSSIDLLASIITYLAVKKSSMPPDDKHQYGHTKIENISSFAEAIFIFIAGGWIIIEAIKNLISPTPIEMIGIGISVMFLSTIVNIFVSNFLLRVSKETSSIALKGDALHLLSDVYTSLGVMVGLIIIWSLEKIFPKYDFYWIDSVSAMIIASIIFRSGLKLTKESISDLIDTAASEVEVKKITQTIKRFPDTLSFKNLKTRKIGDKIFIEFDLILDQKISFEYAHKITELLEKEIKSHFNSQVIIHPEPCQEECSKDCKENCIKN